MNGKVKTDHPMIEHILSVLYLSQCDSIENETNQDDARIKTALEMKALMDEMPGGFFIYRADGDEEILYANKAMLRLFACDSLEEFRCLTGNSFRGLVHPDDLEAVEASIREQIAQNQYDLDYVEYRIIQKGGQVRWVEDYGHFIHSGLAGDLFYVFAGDATEKREQQTEEQRRRIEIIEGLSSTYESILYVNLETDRLIPYRLSNRACPYFEVQEPIRSYETFCSMYVKTWVYPEDQTLVSEALNPVRIHEKLSLSNTYYINYRVNEQDTVQYFQLRIASVSHVDPSARIVLGFRRVDEEIRHEMEQKKLFEEALSHARLANIAKNTFLSNMSHDIRTPLNAITGFVTLARNHIQEPEKLAEYIDRIQTSSELLLSLINDILDLSRMESGTIQTIEVPCCLSDLMAEVHASLSPRAENKHITLSVDSSLLQHPYVYGDPDKLRRLLICFGTNAVKYTDENGQVTIKVTEVKAHSNNYASYEFSVEDNGIGIEPKYLERIFEPFERVKNTTFSGVHGTGLGLTIAKQLAETMDGTISAQSTPGKGSRFTATFNLRIQHERTFEPAQAQDILVERMHGRRILLVDDNDLNLELETELLEDSGFVVETASHGQDALEHLTQKGSDYYGLVLMDIQMPIMNGYEAAQLIRSLEEPKLRSIPIVALSANTFDEDRRMARRSGMNAHIPKPLNIEQLLELMMEII